MIDLTMATEGAIRHLAAIGLSESTITKYTNSGFSHIISHFQKKGISSVSPDMLDSFLHEQDNLFEQGQMSSQQIGYMRRSCDLLMYCSGESAKHFSPSSPWMRTLCRPWQSISKTLPSDLQNSNPDDIFILGWKVYNEIMNLGYAKTTCEHYRLEGVEEILYHFHLNGVNYFSVELLNKLVEEKRAAYIQGTLCESTYCCFRKVAVWMQEMYETGHISAMKIPPWGMRELTAPFSTVFSSFSSDPELSEHLAESSMKTGKCAVRRFLFEMENNGFSSLAEINRSSINQCLTSLAKRFTSGLPTFLYFIRVFFRYLYKKGFIAEDLSKAIPTMLSPRKMFHEGFSRVEIERLLDQPDRDSPLGKRDYAMMVLAVQSGLRACDIVRLELSNINWRESEIKIIQHKTSHPLVLPLENASGNAIADYILHGRPNTTLNNIFLCHTGTIRPMSPGAASGMIARYMKRIEITGGRRAFHALRRTFGTRLLQGETSLDMIQQLLGQKSMNSMKPYLSIDEQGLKQCALPLIKQGKVER